MDALQYKPNLASLAGPTDNKTNGEDSDVSDNEEDDEDDSEEERKTDKKK